MKQSDSGHFGGGGGGGGGGETEVTACIVNKAMIRDKCPWRGEEGRGPGEEGEEGERGENILVVWSFVSQSPSSYVHLGTRQTTSSLNRLSVVGATEVNNASKKDPTCKFSNFQILRYLGPPQLLSYALEIGMSIMALQRPEFFNYVYISIAHINFNATKHLLHCVKVPFCCNDLIVTCQRTH